MHIYDLIYKKRNGGALTAGEIAAIVTGYARGEVPDYQMSAFLMAVFFRGMEPAETDALTEAMLGSGESCDLSEVAGVKVDKHSTGGVGDGVSLVLAPLVASAGVTVPMMAGRGLGHTGGTIDKLESIPGFRTALDRQSLVRQLGRIGVAVTAQTERIAPADRKMYALRDVTATVDSLPLIAASIMSKKLAEGCDALLLDVKTGSGAFMRNPDEARRLASTMIRIGEGLGRKTAAVLSDMDQPLGRAVGNALEVRQSVGILRGEGGPEDFVALTLELGARMLLLAGAAAGKEEALARLRGRLSDGSALNKFREMVEAQGGDPAVADNPDRILPAARLTREILSPAAGYLSGLETREIGCAAVMLGAGRARTGESVDHSAGIVLLKKRGDRVAAGEPLARFYHNGPAQLEEACARFLGSCTISEEQPAPVPLVSEL